MRSWPRAASQEPEAATRAPGLLHVLEFRPRGHRPLDVFLLGLSSRLRERGWRVKFVFSGEPAEPYAASLREKGVEYACLSDPFSWRSAQLIGEWGREMAPCILQTSFCSPFTWPMLALRALGLVDALVMMDHLSGTFEPKTGVREMLSRARTFIAEREIDYILTVSDFVARRDIEGGFFSPEKVRAIHNGIQLRRYPLRSRESSEAIVFVGQLIEEKGVDTLIRAFARVKPDHPQMTLRIFGEGPARKQLEHLAQSLGCPGIEFRGYSDDISAAMSDAAVAVVPSRWAEAFGYVAIEAMACGTPVVASDIGGLPEVVGDAGFLFPPGDDAALAGLLARLMCDKKRRVEAGRRGRLRVERMFDNELRITRHVALLEELRSKRLGA